MTLKIDRISGKRRTRVRLSGAFRSEHLDQVKAEIERGGPRVALDLEEVDLVDVEGVRFLNACEAEGISVLHCWYFQIVTNYHVIKEAHSAIVKLSNGGVLPSKRGSCF